MIEATPHTTTAVILAGGKATRLGGAIKPLLPHPTHPSILAHQCDVIAPLVRDIYVSVAAPVPWTTLPQLVDATPHGGPLHALQGALRTPGLGPWLLVIAGDMPALRTDVLSLLFRPTSSPHVMRGFRHARGCEPLCALYHHACVPTLNRLIEAGPGRVSALLEAGPTAWVDPAALRACDPELRVFSNTNHPQDLPPP